MPLSKSAVFAAFWPRRYNPSHNRGAKVVWNGIQLSALSPLGNVVVLLGRNVENIRFLGKQANVNLGVLPTFVLGKLI